jgi:uncharacterized membrane protein (DUF106 family)
VTIQKTEEKSSSDETMWLIMFILVCILLVGIVLLLIKKRFQDRKEQKAVKATKLYEYQTRKQALTRRSKATTETKFEKEVWDHLAQPNSQLYETKQV